MNNTFILKLIAYAILGGLLSIGSIHALNGDFLLFIMILVVVNFIEYLGYRTGKDA